MPRHTAGHRGRRHCQRRTRQEPPFGRLVWRPCPPAAAGTHHRRHHHLRSGHTGRLVCRHCGGDGADRRDRAGRTAAAAGARPMADFADPALHQSGRVLPAVRRLGQHVGILGVVDRLPVQQGTGPVHARQPRGRRRPPPAPATCPDHAGTAAGVAGEWPVAAPLQLGVLQPAQGQDRAGRCALRALFLPAGQPAGVEPDVWSPRLLPVPERRTDGAGTRRRAGHAAGHLAIG